MGEPQLSNCFFQNFLEGTAQPNFHPILQLMESRAIQNQGPKQYRVRLSDGVFSYSGCTIAPVAVQYFEQDGISTQNAIIQVTNWKRADMNNKAVFNVSDYNLISTDFPVLGNPQTHDGNPDNYRSHMQANAYVKDQQQALVNQQRAQQWQQPSPVKQDPENMGVGGSTKRTRGQSPPDPRQPLTKRQPQPMSISMMPGVMPIKCITPYCNRWRICGIVSGKDAQIKDVKSTKGEFRVFGFIITDQEGTAIRVSAFGEAANKFFTMLENGQVYYIAGGMRSGSIRPANKQFNNTGHDYELTLDKDSEVTYCNEQFHAPKLRLKPVILKNIPQHVNECIDVVAVVERVGEVTQITTKKDQRQLDKRDVFLVDQTASEICFTLWGEQAQHFSLPQGAIIGIKGAIVREFGGGFSISTTSGTQIIENPDHDMTMLLFNWYRDQKPLEFKNLSMSADSSAVFERDFRLIGPILQHGINPENEKGQYFFLKAMVNAVKTEQSVYQACPNCRKKMTSDQNTYRCEKCDQSFDKPNHKMMLQVELADFTGSTWVTIFDELATTMLQVSADDLAHWMDSDRERFDRVFDQIRFHEFLFRVRVRYEQYNDQQQMKWNVFDVKPVPYEKCKQIYAKTLQHLQQMGL